MENNFINVKFISTYEQNIPIPNNLKDILDNYDGIFNKEKIDRLKFYVINNKKKERVYLDEINDDQFKNEIINYKINNKLIISVEEANLQNNKNFINELNRCNKFIKEIIKNNGNDNENDNDNDNEINPKINELIEDMNTKLNEIKESIDSMSLQRINKNLLNKVSEAENVFSELTQAIQENKGGNVDNGSEIDSLKDKIKEISEENEKNKDIINQYKEKLEIQKEEIINVLNENYSKYYQTKINEFLERINLSLKEKMETLANN